MGFIVARVGERTAPGDAGGGRASRGRRPFGPHQTRRCTAEIIDLADRFNQMAAELEDLLARQRDFVADASHQLRTPLTAIRLRLENLEAEIGATGAPMSRRP